MTERFEELAALPAGWAIGLFDAPVGDEDEGIADLEGAVLSRAFLGQVEAQLHRMLPLLKHGMPYVFATVEGGVELMWRMDEVSILLRIHPQFMVLGTHIHANLGTVIRTTWTNFNQNLAQITAWVNDPYAIQNVDDNVP